jgi:hypothetical protein
MVSGSLLKESAQSRNNVIPAQRPATEYLNPGPGSRALRAPAFAVTTVAGEVVVTKYGNLNNLIDERTNVLHRSAVADNGQSSGKPQDSRRTCMRYHQSAFFKPGVPGFQRACASSCFMPACCTRGMINYL